MRVPDKEHRENNSGSMQFLKYWFLFLLFILDQIFQTGQVLLLTESRASACRCYHDFFIKSSWISVSLAIQSFLLNVTFLPESLYLFIKIPEGIETVLIPVNFQWIGGIV